MFRRRPFVRPLRRALAVDVPPALRRANELMAAGQYAGAAEIFEQFGAGALQRGGPRAPVFFLQAGRARLQAGQTGPGADLIKRGLSIFVQRGQLAEAQRAGRRAADELRQRGLVTQAEEIEAQLSLVGPSAVEGLQPAETGQVDGRLPTNCPGCGAPLRPEDVEWLDTATAECPFCGSLVRRES